MHKHLMIGLLLCASYGLQAQSAIDNPIAYFDYFNQEHTLLAQKNMEYLQYSVHSEDLRVIAEKRLALLQQIQGAQSRMEELPDFEGDAGLKKTMLAVLETYQELFEVSFEEIELLKMDAQEGFLEMEKYLTAQTAAEKKMADASARLLGAQQKFASDNHIQLQMEPGSATEAEQLNALNEYQRSIFLRGFRVSKLNAEFLLALDQEDDPGVEQLRRELQRISQVEITELKKIGDYQGDTDYRDAVIGQVVVINVLAEHDYPALVNVKIKGDDLTNEDVEAYNRAITKVNTDLNPATERINVALQQLLRKNVPKPALRGVKQI